MVFIIVLKKVETLLKNRLEIQGDVHEDILNFVLFCLVPTFPFQTPSASLESIIIIKTKKIKTKKKTNLVRDGRIQEDETTTTKSEIVS